MSDPEKTSLIIIACCCLHNMAIQGNVQLDIHELQLQALIRYDRQNGDDDHHVREEGNPYLVGRAKRNHFVDQYFQRGD